MDPDRWRLVNQIFHSALEADPRDRAALIASQSGGDPELQAEVDNLLRADAEVGSYLNEPLLSPAFNAIPAGPIAPGDLLCGRFRIVRSIAGGGMGHVFQAFDTELSVDLALKVIRPDIAANPEAIARFRREVRLARTITHPNVCRTFDMQRDSGDSQAAGTGLVFLTMEFLAGETLAAKIKRDGRLPLDEALRLARQIASALGAAHALNVIHRDMKPANIMLVDRGVSAGSPPSGPPDAVVTDFGLARLDPITLADDQSGFTGTGQPIGTLAYMAPEQLEGAAVSPATDLYAFGLILYEMITGERAFPSTNLLSGIGTRLRGTVPLERLRALNVPPRWRRAIACCLAANPAERPANAEAVIALLEGSGWRSYPFRTLLRTPRRALPRAAAALIFLLLAVALFAGGLRLYQSRADTKLAPGALVYLVPVKNETGEKQLENVTELVRAGLSQSAQINLLDQARVGDLLHDLTRPPDTPITPDLAREIALRAGAARVVFSSITRSAGGYALKIDMQQPDPHDRGRFRDQWTKEFDWTGDASVPADTVSPRLASAVRNATDWIRLRAGESQNDVLQLNSSPEDVTTSSWAALGEYTSSERLQEDGNTARAVVALENAVALDPHFSLAYGRLGDLLFSTARYQDGLRAYSHALDPEQDRRLTRRERDRILGEFAIDAADYPAAEKAYRDQTIYYPGEYRGWSYRGYPLLMMGRMDEAFYTLKRAFSINPAKVNAPYELSRASIAIGDFSQAHHWIDTLRTQNSTELADFTQGIAHFLEHRYAEAALSFRSMQKTQKVSLSSLSYFALARLASELGDDDEARRTLDEGITLDRQNGEKGLEAHLLLARARIESRAGSLDACLRDVQDAVALEASAPTLMVAGAVLGDAHRRARGTQAAALRAELLALEKQLPAESFGAITDLARFRLRGEILLAQDDRKAAVAQFRKAAALDAASNGREYLARALDISAGHEPDPASALKLRRAALEAYSAAALRPNLLWFDSVDNLPGCYSDQAEAFLRLAANTPGTESQAGFVRQELQALRGNKLPQTRIPQSPSAPPTAPAASKENLHASR